MRRSTLGCRVTLAVIGSLIPIADGQAHGSDQQFALDRAAAKRRQEITTRVATTTVPFVENRGQITDTNVAFCAQTFGGPVYVTWQGELVYGLLKAEEPGKDQGASNCLSLQGTRNRERVTRGVAMKERLIGGRKPALVGVLRASAVVSYFRGHDPKQWQSALNTWEMVSLGEVYGGIEVALRAHGNNVEKLFLIQPGADPALIRVEIEGSGPLAVGEDGSLVARSSYGDVRFTAPLAYQDIAGQRREVRAAYRVDGSQYAFDVGSYDETHPLVIDPLLASTYLGGSGVEGFMSVAIAIDPRGNVFVAGCSSSTNYPTLAGAFSVTNSGDNDLIISKLDPNLTNILASTYLGGSSLDGDDTVALVLDATGNVVLAAYSTSTNYPTTPGAYSRTKKGTIYEDLVISKLGPDLTNLLASTYLGGTSSDIAPALVLDPTGNVFVACATYSTDYPTTAAAYSRVNKGFYDIAVSRLDANLSNLLASTYLGGSGYESMSGLALALDPTGNVLVAGNTDSGDYPTTAGAYSRTKKAGVDIVLSKLNPALTDLLASTYLGGNGTEGDEITLVTDSTGNALIAADSNSTDFPTTPGAFSRTNKGGYDIVLSKLNASLTNLLASTYIGGSGNEWSRNLALALGPAGKVFVASCSSSTNYPTTVGAFSRTNRGATDIAVSKLDDNLANLLASTYIGGTSNEYAYALALDAAGNVVVAGASSSTNYPTTADAYCRTNRGGNVAGFGGNDLIISKLDPNLGPPLVAITAISVAMTGDVLVRWHAENAWRYTLQVGTNLNSPMWYDIAPTARPGPVGAPWEMWGTNVGGVWTNPASFYRVNATP